MKIAIIGTGGVGGYFGGKLANAGYDVTFLARGEHLQAMKENGLVVNSISGDFAVQPVKAVDKINEIGISDLIILGLKAWQLKEVAGELLEIIDENSTVLPLQNGVVAVDDLKETIDQKNLLNGLCRIGSKIESPGIITHFAADPSIIFGEIDNSKTERTQKVQQVFDETGINARIADNIELEIWKKFLTICSGGLLAVSQATFGEIRGTPETRQMLLDLFKEVREVAVKKGINIEADYPDKVMAFIDTFPYDATPSLARDVWEGKPSEIEYKNGMVVKLADQLGVDVPMNRYIYHCILPMEKKARRLASPVS